MGTTLSNDLTWITHISTIYENASKRLNLLKGLKFKLNRSTLNAMYLTLIRPLMEYADFIWDGCSSESTVLESIQYEAARLVTGAIKGTNRQSLLEELGWVPLKTRRYVHKISMFYKMMNNLVPNYLSSLIPCQVSDRTTYPLRNSDDVSLLSCSTSRFQKSFLLSAISAWNSLSIDIRNSPSLGNFKSKVSRLFLSDKRCILHEVGSRYASILHTRLRLHNSSLNYDLFQHNCISSPACECGYYQETSGVDKGGQDGAQPPQ